MPSTIARFSDHVNALNNVHRNLSTVCYGEGMTTDWKERLKEAIDASGRSMRNISSALKMGPNGVSEIFSSNKEPSVTKVLRIIDELGASRSEIIAGVPLSKDVEDLIRLLNGLNPEQLRLALEVVRQMQPSAGNPGIPGAALGPTAKSE